MARKDNIYCYYNYYGYSTTGTTTEKCKQNKKISFFINVCTYTDIYIYI